MAVYGKEELEVDVIANDRFSDVLERFAGAIMNADKVMQGFEQVASGNVVRGVATLATGLGTVGLAAAGAAAAVAAVGAAIYKLDEQGDALNRQIRMMEAVSSSYTGSRDTVARAADGIREASNNILTTMQAEELAMRSLIATRGRATEAMNLYARAARDLSVVTGTSYGSAFTSIVSGVQSGRPGDADKATGGMLNIAGAVYDWQKATGKTLSYLPPDEQRRVLEQLTAQQASTLADTAGMSGTTRQESLAGIKASVKSNWETMLSDFGEAVRLDDIYEGLNKAMQEAREDTAEFSDRRAEIARQMDVISSGGGGYTDEERIGIMAELRGQKRDLFLRESRLKPIADFFNKDRIDYNYADWATPAMSTIPNQPGALQLADERLGKLPAFATSTLQMGTLGIERQQAIEKMWEDMMAGSEGWSGVNQQILTVAGALDQAVKSGGPLAELMREVSKSVTDMDVSKVNALLAATSGMEGVEGTSMGIVRERAERMAQMQSSGEAGRLMSTLSWDRITAGQDGQAATTGRMQQFAAGLREASRASEPLKEFFAMLEKPAGKLDFGGILEQLSQLEQAGAFTAGDISPELIRENIAAYQQFLDTSVKTAMATKDQAAAFEELARAAGMPNASVLDLVRSFSSLPPQVQAALREMDTFSAVMAKINEQARDGSFAQWMMTIASAQGMFGSINQSFLPLAGQGVGAQQIMSSSAQAQAYYASNLSPYTVKALTAMGREDYLAMAQAGSMSEINDAIRYLGSGQQRAQYGANLERQFESFSRGLFQEIGRIGLPVTAAQVAETKAGTYQDVFMEKARRYDDIVNLKTMSPFYKTLIPADIAAQGEDAAAAFAAGRSEEIKDFAGSPDDYNWDAFFRQLSERGTKKQRQDALFERYQQEVKARGLEGMQREEFMENMGQPPDFGDLNLAPLDATLRKLIELEEKKYNMSEGVMGGDKTGTAAIAATRKTAAEKKLERGEVTLGAVSADGVPAPTAGEEEAAAAGSGTIIVKADISGKAVEVTRESVQKLLNSITLDGLPIANAFATALKSAASDPKVKVLNEAGETLARRVLAGYTEYLNENMDPFVKVVAAKVAELLVVVPPKKSGSSSSGGAAP